MQDGAKTKELRPLLKEIDPDFDIDFNFDTETYTVYHKGAFFRSVPYGEFDREIFSDIRRMVWLNRNGDVFRDMDENNALVEKRKERETELLAESLAKDIRKPLIRAYDGM